MPCNNSNLTNAQTSSVTPIKPGLRGVSLVCQIPLPQGYATRGALFSLTGTLHRDAAPPLLLEQSAGNAHAQHIHPAFVEIEYVRIEQRGENILHHHHQSDPYCQAVAAEQQQMLQPHRI